MTYQNDFTLPEALLEQVSNNGLSGLPDLLGLLFNAAMQLERQRYLNAQPHERTEQRTGHANGYKDKTLQTRIGEITVAIPQVREGGFYPHALEKGIRSERALKLALAEMYVQGVSTRRVAANSKDRAQSSVLCEGFRQLLSRMPNSSWLFDANGALADIAALTSEFRNRAAHTDELTKSDYNKCFALVVSDKNGILWRLVDATTDIKDSQRSKLI